MNRLAETDPPDIRRPVIPRQERVNHCREQTGDAQQQTACNQRHGRIPAGRDPRMYLDRFALKGMARLYQTQYQNAVKEERKSVKIA
ncbi:MAG TPA: hypothetical protein VJ746_07625 [Nitrospira sp.]|nr:hypothetical protein [Nitrospira sp.]